MRACQDLFGSNAYAEGGIFGRIDAVYTSIETQKSTGSCHAHSQVWVQCVHQHTPLSQLFAVAHDDTKHLISRYLRYKSHVSRQVYATVPSDADIRTMENDWPEQRDATRIMCRPSYLAMRSTDVHGDPASWLRSYLHNDVDMLQLYRQHHVHIYSDKSKKREPLTACQRKDKPSECKSDFPRTKWMIDDVVVLCQGLIRKMNMEESGRRSKLGALHGPMNQE